MFTLSYRILPFLAQSCATFGFLLLTEHAAWEDSKIHMVPRRGPIQQSLSKLHFKTVIDFRAFVRSLCSVTCTSI
ncbi:hypothetical protein B0O99DRAFT_617111 [Bisporella sp. PMI_857]|nr:hypothetical protein B0O99DRAFT_617111 [Bisporella sp. PMI_857]